MIVCFVNCMIFHTNNEQKSKTSPRPRRCPPPPTPEPFFSRTRKLPCIFAALFVCYSSRLRLRDSLLRPCYDFLLFFTTQTRPVHRETDSGDEKFITPINKIHNPILGYDLTFFDQSRRRRSCPWASCPFKSGLVLYFFL